MLGANGTGVLAGCLRSLKPVGVKAGDSFEIAFNLACAALADGDVPSAKRYLEQADQRGQDMLTEEGATPEVCLR